MKIDRCVCTGFSFKELLTLAATNNLTIDQLADRTGCCQRCALCKPYLMRGFDTGEHSFSELMVSQGEREPH